MNKLKCSLSYRIKYKFKFRLNNFKLEVHTINEVELIIKLAGQKYILNR